MKRIAAIFASMMLVFTVFAGCSAQTDNLETDTSPATGSTALVSDTAVEDAMFTDRDKEIGYSEAESTIITLADNASTSSGQGATVKADTVTISSEGTYILTGSLSDGQVIVDAADEAKIQLVLNGVDITNNSSAAIYVKNANKVFITTAADSENTLSVAGEYVAIDDNNIDAVIFSKSDLTLNGAGTLEINAKYGHGVVSKDDLAATSGAYVITAASQGLSGKNSVRIAEGTYTIKAGTDGIHSENEDDTTLGFVYVEGGTISIGAGDDGIHAETKASIVGGTIDITDSYEGIEAMNIEISGGEISVSASDDGLNAAGGNDQSGGADRMNMVDSDCVISISGGKLTVNSTGDGIDSNGTLEISGGVITVSGPTDNGNGTFDFGTAKITGGTVLGAGSSAMAQGFAESSTQGSIVYVFSGTQQAGTTVVLKDAGGKVLAEFTPEKQFQSVNLSVAGLESGSTYTLCVGAQEFTVDMTSITYSNGFGGMAGGQGGMGGQMPQGGMGGKEKPAIGGTDANSSATVS